jgi:hypothetical protein
LYNPHFALKEEEIKDKIVELTRCQASLKVKYFNDIEGIANAIRHKIARWTELKPSPKLFKKSSGQYTVKGETFDLGPKIVMTQGTGCGTCNMFPILKDRSDGGKEIESYQIANGETCGPLWED